MKLTTQQFVFGIFITNSFVPLMWHSSDKQDACTGVHSACRREENGHNLDICVLRRLRLRQGQMQGFLGLKVWGGSLNLQVWDLNRAHETERTVFLILQVFSMCVKNSGVRLIIKRNFLSYKRFI